VKVLWVVVDSLRADACGFAGGAAGTPTLDRLAAEGSSFSQAFCSASWTIPSLCSMDTGAFPHQLGVCHWGHRLPARHTSMMATFRRAGWRVAAFTPNPEWSFRGWPDRPVVGHVHAEEEMLAAVRAPGDALFLVHHGGTRFPYVTKQRTRAGLQSAAHLGIAALRQNHARLAPTFLGLYRRAIHLWSEERLPRLLDALCHGGEEVLVAITADHGESLGEYMPDGPRPRHIFDLHGRWLRDATTQVPLVFWGNTVGGAVPAGQVLGGFARGVDLGPTLCDAAGIPWEPARVARRGVTLLPSLMGGQPAPSLDALTVRGHNTQDPDTYPENGRAMWRGYSLRSAEGRTTWDAVDDPIPAGPARALYAEWEAAADSPALVQGAAELLAPNR
jgi:arylsulfatase A-like enzyme